MEQWSGVSVPPLVARPLFLLDYDGTLAQIVDDPDHARPHPNAAQILEDLAERFPVRLLTGRRVADLARLLQVPQLVAIGVHGLEEGRLGGAVRWRLDEEGIARLNQVRERLPKIAGVRVEDKGGAIALHYRSATASEAEGEAQVRGELRDWAQDLPPELELVWGKKVVEVRPQGFDKGRAALEIASRHGGATAVMIGDDTTDEDAFRALSALEQESVTIKVGLGESAARYRLAGVDEVIGYLRRYLA
ncbi:MAG: trehalose-phosphatase [Trueperaceae bacterium]